MACNYSPKFISLLASKSEMMPELEFKNWVTTYFNDGELVYTRFMNGALFREGGTINPSGKQSTNSNWGRFTYDQEAHTFADYYRGADDLRLKAEQDFKTEIVRQLIFDFKEENPDLRWKDSAGSVNEVIAEYKESLANALLQELGKDPISLNETLSNDEYTKLIEDTLTDYRQFLSTNPSTVENYDKFVILSIFDTLLDSYADFVSPKPEFINPRTKKAIKTDGFNKYEYKGPNVQHYTGYMSSEFAAIENQDSNLAKILLDVIPEINQDGTPIPNSFIGLSGFNAPMTAVKNWVLFEAPTEIRNEYNKGAKADISKIIDAYINWVSIANRDVTSYYDNRRTFLISKLRSIQHYLFNANTDSAIRAMFAGMFFKTENVSYRVYDYDQNLGRVAGRNLKSSFINSQKFSFEDKISGVSYLVYTNSAQRDNIKSKYKLTNVRGSVRIQNINDPAEYVEVCLYKKDNAAEGTINGSYSDKFIKDIIKDFLMFVLPDTYEQVGRSTEGNDWKWEQDFAPFIALIAYDVNGQTITAINRKKGSVPDLKPLNKATLRVAQKLSTIYGSETRNVVKNPSGNNLPVYQLTNLTYNIQSVIDDIVAGTESLSGVSNQNLLVEARQLLISPQVRNQVSINGRTKDASSLTIKELLELGVLHDFYGAFLNKDSNTEYGKIYLQSATYADKGTHYLVGYDLNKTITTSFGDINLFDIIQEVIKTGDSSKLLEITRHFRVNRINAAVTHLLSDYNAVYKDQQFKTLDQLDEFLKTKKYDDVVKDFESAGINFIEEFHGYKPKNNSLGSIRVNETLKSQYDIFNDPKKFEDRINKARQAFIQNIDENRWKWNRYDNPLIDQIYGNKAYKDFQGNNGDVYTHIGDRLHPILEAYFMSDVLLSNEYNSIAIGEVYYHPNKNSTLTNTNPEEGEVGTYEEFSEANRLIAQIKRSVAFGATYHPYIQGLDNGVTSTIQVAVMNDIKGIVFTPNGDENDDLDSSDGSGLAHPLQARFENNSLLDARVGMNKKSIMMSLDPRTGKPTLLKWAVYAIDNEMRRNGYFAKASTELLYKKMSSGEITGLSTGLLNELVTNYEGGLIYKDFTTGVTYRVTGIEDTETGYRQHRVIVKSDGSTEAADDKIFTKGTLYDLDQLFGGCWTGNYKNGQWIYNEANLDLLEKLFIKGRKDGNQLGNSLDKSFIAYAVNKSAIKVGAEAINPSARFSNDEELRTFTMSTKYGGVQMNADHDLDLAEVTEMTQMISALTEDGHYKDVVESIYQDIGETVAAHMAKLNTAVDDVIKTGTEESKRELYKILADSWIRSFENSNKDTIGIAQAFVKRASEAFRNGNFDFRIPFSAATINGSFISDVVSSINRGGIRHKYEGFAGVLNPSHDMIMYYRVWNEETGKWETRMFDQFADFARGSFTPYTFNSQTVNSVLVNGQLNPLCKESNYNDISFEDTVVITKTLPDGTEVLVHDIYPDGGDSDAVYLNSFTAYDTVKHYLRNNSGCKVYIHTGRPRNLAAGNVRFKVDGRWYSIYDLDSVRSSQYLTKALNKASKTKSGDIEQFLTPDQLVTIKQTLGYNYIRLVADKANKNEIYSRALDLIKKLNAKTETTLKNIEKGSRIDNNEAFITRHLERLDIDGNVINLNQFQAALALMGPKKQVDVESAIDLIQENIEDATDYNPITRSSIIANWFVSILQDPTTLSEDNLPIGLNGIARQKVTEVISTSQDFDNLSRKYKEFPEDVRISALAEAYNRVQDAWTNLYDYIADEHFTGLRLEHNIRKIAKNEQTVPWDTSVTTTDYVVDAPEIIMGRYQGEKFGIGENDHIYQISDYHYFEDKLQSKYTLPNYTESELFDAILYGNDEQFLIKIGELPEELSGRLSESTDFTEIDGDIYYEGVKIGSNQNKQFFTYLDETGGKHHVILVNNADTFREIRRSSLFDDVIRYNWTDENFDILKNVKFGNKDRFRIYYDSEHTTEVSLDELTLGEAQVDETIRLDKRIRNQAQDMYESFDKQLNYVGARIPTQAMQSFMPMRTIAWVNTLTNMVYVPKVQTYLEGSDYDKFYLVVVKFL